MGLPFPLAAWVEETTVGGARFLRLRLPDADGGFFRDELRNLNTVRAIAACSEDHARRTAARQWHQQGAGRG